MVETILLMIVIAAILIAFPEARKADGRPAAAQPREMEDGRENDGRI